MTLSSRSLQLITVALASALLSVGMLSCTTPQRSSASPSAARSSDTLIGRPPPAEGDPFLRAALPPEARPAEARGRIERVDPRTPACFSCVKLCRPGDLTPECSDSPEDVICGWGAHTDDIAARERARAHCEATLDLARRDKSYPIEGQCPPATCW